VDFASFLNAQDCLAQARLQPLTQFGLLPKPGVVQVTQASQLTAVIANDGRFALFNFLDALPRAKLYSRWQPGTNDAAVLQAMFDPAFDPAKSVFVAGDVPVNPVAESNSPPGTVAIVHYAPQQIALQAEAPTASVLLLNDHFDPNWKVFVDGQPAALLRCNFLMRGVHLAPGTHQVEFKFQPPTGWLYVSLAAVATTVLILGGFMIRTWKNRAAIPAAVILAPVPAPPLTASRRPENRKVDRRNRVAKR
jgi:hypothetical protein